MMKKIFILKKGCHNGTKYVIMEPNSFQTTRSLFLNNHFSNSLRVTLNRVPTHSHPLPSTPTHSHPLPSTPTHSQPFQTMPSIIILTIVYYIVHYNAQPTDYQILNIFPTPAIIPTPRLLETGEYTNQNLKSTQSKTVTPKGKEKWTPDCI